MIETCSTCHMQLQDLQEALNDKELELMELREKHVQLQVCVQYLPFTAQGKLTLSSCPQHQTHACWVHRVELP
jgi:hypothetical protein